eukprot:TRINITY_DN82_c3_g1_i3.p1 TRINITY_DN82_c3_g1~~TRINITY_DN82_c3_g1_i3.p1  ORF type:complete len:321 (-),score=32.26 TRINITY_DN82_c3_g1_i3:119-1057(-)
MSTLNGQSHLVDLQYQLIPLALYTPKETPSLQEVLNKAGKKALRGGIPGMAAMGIQVCTLMWLRTTVNYQYRYGMSTWGALKYLYKEGGIPRFYRGLLPALIQGPVSRFGDTAANTGMLALLESYELTGKLPVGVKTVAASAAAAGFRIFLMPVDALKTTLQVEGAKGIPTLANKIGKGGPLVLWHGSLAAVSATFVGHYPWFATYNYLNELLPQYDDLPRRLSRSAVIGFCASAVSDTCSNSIRVLKTTRQTSEVPIGYFQAAKMIVQKDGWEGLFFRGLRTKIIANGLQGLLFSVLWRLGQDIYDKKYGK